jgi:hypothetical protein
MIRVRPPHRALGFELALERPDSTDQPPLLGARAQVRRQPSEEHDDEPEHRGGEDRMHGLPLPAPETEIDPDQLGPVSGGEYESQDEGDERGGSQGG